ncbi:MAG: hypothetical protein QXN95_00240 [Candidatus Bathyarchaeia archaeon]
MKTKIVDVGDEYGEEYKGRYVFQEITWAKRTRIIQKYTKYHPITGQVVASDYTAIQAETIWASLKEQPPNKPITLDKLLSEDPENGIPIGLGELFSRVANELCTVSREEAAFLSEPSEGESRILPSRFTGLQKSSGGQ